MGSPSLLRTRSTAWLAMCVPSANWTPSGSTDAMAVLSRTCTPRASSSRTASAFECGENALRSEPVASMSTTSARRDVEGVEVLGEHLREQLGERAAELHAGRPASCNHDAQSTVLDQGVIPVGGLELLQHGPAHLDRVLERLQSERMLTDPGNAEVAAHGAHREDQIVVGDRIAVGDQHVTTPRSRSRRRAPSGTRRSALASRHHARSARCRQARRRRSRPGRGEARTCGSCTGRSE